MKVHMYPVASGPDDGQGGVRRVIDGMLRHLPDFGVEFVDRPENADLIACHITIPPEWLRMFPEKAFVEHCHGLYWAEYDWPRWAEQANTDVMEAIRVADAVTVPSEWVADVVTRHTVRKPVVVPHGLDLEEWSPGENIGYVLWDKTRPDPICDPELMQQVAAMMPDVQFLSTFGEPTANVTVVGRMSFLQAKELVRGAAVYLATSRETFGVATIQALACGVPVVGYRWGAQPEIVEHGVNGWLARPYDVADLAEGIRWALANRAAIAPRARLAAERYPWRRAAEMYARVYADALAKRRAVAHEPKVSIIVRAYNLAKYLPETLNSVRDQTAPYWECIIVDDASPDDCGRIADDYARLDPRFRVIHNERNEYISEAMNIGIRAAKGAYILPLDADDQLTRGAVETLARALDGDRAAHVVYGNVRFVQEDGYTPMDYGTGNPGHSGWPMPFRWHWQMNERNLLPYSSMFRREAWELTGGFRRRCKTAEDADFWARISSYGFRPKMVTDADTLVYRVRPDSVSRVAGSAPWMAWFPWRNESRRSPAGAVAEGQLPIPSLLPPAVSVVIPVGPGHERIVADAVDSVEAQTLRHWECIVVNDSGNKLIELPSWVRVLDTGGGAGVAAARNLGVSHARARVFLPLDADDLLEPLALEVFFETYKARDGVVLYSDFWEDPGEAGQFVRYQTEDWQAEKLLTKGTLATVTQLTPVAAWREVGGYQDGAWEDWAFQLRLARAGICSARIAQPLFTYRKHSGFRRERNYQSFEQSKSDILAEFADYFEGKATLMACGCSGGQTATAAPVLATGDPAYGPGSADAGVVLMLYDGDRVAATQFKAPSGQIYRFAKGDQKYVAAQDVGHLMERWPGFVVMQAPDVPVAMGNAPELISMNADALAREPAPV